MDKNATKIAVIAPNKKKGFGIPPIFKAYWICILRLFYISKNDTNSNQYLIILQFTPTISSLFHSCPTTSCLVPSHINFKKTLEAPALATRSALNCWTHSPLYYWCGFTDGVHFRMAKFPQFWLGIWFDWNKILFRFYIWVKNWIGILNIL